MTFNIIADIAGRYNELQKLLDIMPRVDKTILVGDLMDRGLDSKKVIEWAMNTPNVITLKGNHEIIMINAFHTGYDGYRVQNGYQPTLDSYGINNPNDFPESHIKWMEKLPLYVVAPELFVSHAPWLGALPKANEECSKWEHQIVWNRFPPKKVEGMYQIHGHNTVFKRYRDENDLEDWGICLDNSGNKKLTGLYWPSKDIYEVDYEL